MPRPYLAGHRAPPWALLASIVLAACAGAGTDQQALADSALARDLALVQSAAAEQPIFRDTALTTTPAPRAATAPEPPVERSVRRREVTPPARPREQVRRVPEPESRRPTRVAEAPPEPDEPAPQPAQSTGSAGGSVAGVIGAGAVLGGTSNARVCTRSNLPGDRITATVNAPVRGTNGAEIPAGSKVVLEVASIDPGDAAGEGRVVFRVHSVAIGDDSYAASGSATANGPLEQVQAQNGSSDKKKVIGGAIAGAILGQIMGKDTRSTVIGAAAGAAAGTAAAKMGERGEGCLAAGTALRITLDEPIAMR
jgi:hypothetical protein